MTALSVAFAIVLTACGGSGSADVTPVPDEGVIPSPPPIPPLDVVISDLIVIPGPDAGSVQLRFTAPGAAGDSPPDAYRVRSSVRHITPDDQAGAVIVPVSATPGAPGTAEVLTVGGLVPDRTLQFTVQTVRGGKDGPLGAGVGGRVAGRDVPATPTDPILLTGPATLSQAGATYRLTQDVTTSGTAFRITEPGITLDLGGYRVVYGSDAERHYGIVTEYPGSGTTPITVRNGTIVQSSTTAQNGHGLFLRGLDDVRVSYLDVTVVGPGADGIFITEAENVRVDHCTVACRVTDVPNRHYPGVSAILVEHANGRVELDENLVSASPQWGLRVRGSETDTALVHHNRVIGTKALVANGYMLGIHSPNLEAYENELRGESRGVHVDAMDEAGRDAWIHDNRMECQDQPNPEYANRHWVHGVKIEGAPGCRVERNHVRCTADAEHGDAYALDVDIGTATGVLVRHNVFQGISVTPTLEGEAVRWSRGTASPPTDALVHENVFTATDTLVFRSWDGQGGGLFWSNWWHRDLSQGAEHEFDFEHFWNADDRPSLGHRFVDPHPASLARDAGQRTLAAAYDSTREGTLTVRVADGETALPGATVTVKDAADASVWQGTTDAEGRVAGIVRYTTLTNGPTFTEDGPHEVTVAKSGFTTWQGTVTVEGRTGLAVDLAAGAGHVDGMAPTAPTGVVAAPLSACRTLLDWSAATDDVAVAAYLVFLDGKPAAITETPGVYLGGLEADTSYSVTVKALGAGGQESAASAAVTVRTRPEDRGP